MLLHGLARVVLICRGLLPLLVILNSEKTRV